ncbi:MAG: 50S ribosomal protein L25 [Bacteroidales bacterium]|nr:50S ribosomal protein L25 [Bacteroidales bacterium]
MQHFELKGQIRQAANKAVIKAYRRQGLVPCNLYGLGLENVLFTVDAKDLKGLTNTPKSYIVDLALDNGKNYTAILHELQWHPVSDECLHVDFLAVDQEKPIAIKVPVTISGHAAGVQRGGKFYQLLREVKVCGTMANLPDELPIDITPLNLDQQFKASDLKVENLTILTPKGTVICGVKSTRNSVAETPAEE